LTLIVLLGCAGAPAAGAELSIATWNLEHLAAAPGSGCRPRTEADYARLRRAAERLDADIVALQEVESEAAVERVFDPEEYQVVLSSRTTDVSKRCRGTPQQRMTPLRTAFAVRQARLDELGLRWHERPPLEALGVGGLRWGTRIRVEPAPRRWMFGFGRDRAEGLELMSLHLKAGCHYGALGGEQSPERLRREQCETLRRQRGILEEWIDDQAVAGRAFVIAGDFNRQLDQPNDHFWQAIDDGAVCTWEPHAVLGRRCESGSSRDHRLMRLRLAGAGLAFPYPLNRRYPYAIDHIVAGGDAADWVLPGTYEVLGYRPGSAPSDHHPIRVRLDLPWPQ
jgi:endonuclease/exonuclease/phosphatase family metal-dependent hydrolase